nr:hypothetical protein [Tanacetum cinerariifolium]
AASGGRPAGCRRWGGEYYLSGVGGGSGEVVVASGGE